MRSAWIVAAVLLVCGQAVAAETLSVPPYPAAAPWKKITDIHNDKQVWIEWIPADQSADDVQDILTEQIFYAQKGQSAADFLTGVFQRIAGACRAVSVNGPVPGTENGYGIAYGQVYCVGQKGADKDVDIFIKAIAGNDALYVVQREFRRPAAPGAVPGLRKFPNDEGDAARAALAAQREANDYLENQVKLCADATAGACGGAGGAAAPPASQDSDDVSPSFGFVAGKTTQDEVEDKFGRPMVQSHIPDGHHVDTYSFKDGSLIVSFLFDKDGVLVRTRAYARN
ncbi:MAG TPA: hypothetical protein VMH86_15625 [Rhizomicrobium sp.]|nr:hypothetical protein [Rhizomicrobium sp.]